MQNSCQWVPTKFVIRKNKLKASRNTIYVRFASRLVVNVVASKYEKIIPEFFCGKMIDLGCAAVPLYGYYKDFISEVICVDWAESFHKSRHIDIVQDLNQPLQIEDNQFDTALLSDVLEHIREPQKLINEVFRILKPGGKLILNVPFMYWLHEDPYDYFRFTSYGLVYLLKSSGFEIVKLEEYGGAPEIIADIFAKNIKKIPLLGKPLALFSQWSCLKFVNTSIGKKISSKTAKKFPLGYIVVARK